MPKKHSMETIGEVAGRLLQHVALEVVCQHILEIADAKEKGADRFALGVIRSGSDLKLSFENAPPEQRRHVASIAEEDGIIALANSKEQKAVAEGMRLAVAILRGHKIE